MQKVTGDEREVEGQAPGRAFTMLQKAPACSGLGEPGKWKVGSGVGTWLLALVLMGPQAVCLCS